MAANNFKDFSDFQDFADKHKKRGICHSSDEPDYEPDYVPYEDLQRYWQNDKINTILKSSKRQISILNKDVSQRFLRIFSILVYISELGNVKISYVQQFFTTNIDDKHMPLTKPHSVFANSPDGQNIFRTFSKYQYLFCPVLLNVCMHLKSLNPHDVLPISFECDLSDRNSDGSILRKYTLHPSSLLEAPGNTIVIKETNSDFEFNNEVEAYTVLENEEEMDRASKYFLKYYGSFTQNGKGFILLEYANQGSLLKFFATNNLPHERDELRQLWEGLANLFVGLNMLHGLNQRATGNALRGVHQDLKPGNIFVFQDENNGPYNYRFKIGDFGLTSIKLITAKCKMFAGPDNQSTKMYGAPELTTNHPDLTWIDKGASWDVDIWSLGCVFIETAVWTVCGERGRDEFFAMRRQDTSSVRNHHEQGYEACFHDGEKRIEAVDKMLRTIIGRRRIFDNLTDRLGNLFLEDMLRPKDKGRLRADQLRPRLLDILESPTSPAYNPIQSPASYEHAIPARPPSSPISPSYADMTPDLNIGRSASVRGQRSQNHTRDQALESIQSYSKWDPVQPWSRRTQTPRGISPPFGSLDDRFTSNQNLESYNLTRNGGGPSQSDQYPEYCQEESSRSDPMEANLGDPTRSTEASESSRYRQNRRPDSGYSRRDGNPTTEDADLQRPRTTSSSKSSKPPTKKETAAPTARDQYPKTSIEQVTSWINSRKRGMMKDLPGRETVINQLGTREQIFIIDDSTSMKKHWTDVTKAFTALSYLVKSVDPDGIELFLTSQPRIPKKARKDKRAALSEYVKQRRSETTIGNCNMESSLSQIFKGVKTRLSSSSSGFRLQKQSEAVSIYIFTDGVWEPSDSTKCGVENPIKSLVTEMKQLNLDRTHVSLQFIRFGDSPIGKKRLQYLDNELGKELNFDIVDHRSNRSNVWLMLIGSLSRAIDESDDDTDEGDEKGKGKEIG